MSRKHIELSLSYAYASNRLQVVARTSAGFASLVIRITCNIISARNYYSSLRGQEVVYFHFHPISTFILVSCHQSSFIFLLSGPRCFQAPTTMSREKSLWTRISHESIHPCNV